MNRRSSRVSPARFLAFGALALGAFAVRASAQAWTRPSSGPVLYLFAHEDDEIFALGRMREDVANGRQVYSAWITDGRKDGRPEARERESRAVMARVGVPADNLRFLDFPDHESIHHLAAIHDELRELQRDLGCVELVSPAYEGGNIDHDVVAFVATMITRESGDAIAHFEFPLYNHLHGHRRVNEFLPHPDAEVQYLPLYGEAGQLVRDSLKLYASQRFLLMMLEVTGHKKMLLERGQPFRRAVAYDFMERPAAEPCGYEVSGLHRARFSVWVDAVNSFMQMQAGAH